MCEEYGITRKRTKRMHFKYWGREECRKSLGKLWDILRSGGNLHYTGSDEELSMFCSLHEREDQSFRDLGVLQQQLPIFNISAFTEKANNYKALCDFFKKLLFLQKELTGPEG